MARILKSDFRPGFVSQVTADWLNTVARRLNNIRLQNGEVEIDEFGIDLYPGLYGADSNGSYKQSFDILEVVQSTGTKPVITVAEGYVNLQGNSPVLAAQTDLEIERYPNGGSAVAPVYLFIEMPDGGSALIKQQTGGTRPQTTPGTWRKVLYECWVDTSDYVVVTWDRRIDFDLGSPI